MSFTDYIFENGGYDIVGGNIVLNGVIQHQNVFSTLFTGWLASEAVFGGDPFKAWFAAALDDLVGTGDLDPTQRTDILQLFAEGNYQIKLNQNSSDGAPYIEFAEFEFLTDLLNFESLFGGADSLTWTKGSTEQTRNYFDTFLLGEAENLAPTDIRIDISAALAVAVHGESDTTNPLSNIPANTTTGTGTVIGTLSAVDPDDDPGDLIFTIVSDPSGRFEIIDGNVLKLRAGEEIKEGDGTFTLTIKVTDSANNEFYETFNFVAGTSNNQDLDGTNSDGLGTDAEPKVGDDIIFGFRGNDGLNTTDDEAMTLFGTSGDDALFGGRGNDRLFGGEGDDQLFGGAGHDKLFGESGNDILWGGDGNDQFHMIAPSENGSDVIMDFFNGNNKVGLLQDGDGWNAASTVATADGATLNAADYQVRNGIDGIVAADDNKVVEIQLGLDTDAITGDVGAAVNAYLLVFNTDTGRGELWHDTDWSDSDDRVQVATFDDIDLLVELTGLSNTNFVEWV
jgi:Ca2+-binding RTX toxin-like protein